VRGTIAIATGLLAAACGNSQHVSNLAGGDITVFDRTPTAYSHPAPGMSQDDLGQHNAGQGQFQFQWEPPDLGPQYNNYRCSGCHSGEGRGLSQIGAGFIPPNGEGIPASEALLRVSLGSGTPMFPGGPVPVPTIGLQLHDHAVNGVQQANIVQTWVDVPGSFGDGSPFTLRQPSLHITEADGSQLSADVPGILESFRQAPGVFGLGLLEAVPAATIMALADPTDANGDGIKGIPNMVWSIELDATVLGRFGHKANQPDIVQQVAAAFQGDIGITNPMFPDPTTGGTKIGGNALTATEFFIQTNAVPAPAELVGDAGYGSQLFQEFNCTGCHVTTLVTGTTTPTGAAVPAYLANQIIHPYTDLLVHNMGPGLADNRPDFLADGQSWRTAPLWGLGLVQTVAPGATFLHDGRARTIEEAILWHQGEATAAEEAYRKAARSDRLALLDFLSSL
jgi:CxxC motif-containing protein (DUF1111 family)